VHRNVLANFQSWDDETQRRVGSIVLREFDKNINPTLVDPSVGDIRFHMVVEPVFIDESHLQIAGRTLLEVLGLFEAWINQNVTERVGVTDMTMIIAGNPDNAAWGWSPVGVPLARCSQGHHRAMVTIGTMMFNTQNNVGRVTRHEIGHYFGSHHDGDPHTRHCPLIHIMQPTVSDTVTWSFCSRNSMQLHLTRLVAGNCFMGDPNDACPDGYRRYFPDRFSLGGAWSTADGCGCDQGDPCGCGCGLDGVALCRQCCAMIDNKCHSKPVNPPNPPN